jgi:hypothetical protein
MIHTQKTATFLSKRQVLIKNKKKEQENAVKLDNSIIRQTRVIALVQRIC